MEYKKMYETFWQKSIDSKVEFSSYERNLALDDFFPEVERNGTVVVDIAGGAGIVSEWLLSRGYDVHLVELSDIAVENARQRGITNITQLMIDSDTKLPFEDESIDCIMFGDIIEHLFDSEPILLEIRRILKKNGYVVISCPNVAYWRGRLDFLLSGSLEKVDIVQQKPWEKEHIRFYNKKILSEYLGGLGFTIPLHRGVNRIFPFNHLCKYFPNIFGNILIVKAVKR